MNPQLLSYIRELSLRDPKTLSQKALKAAVELGELSKKILAFENAAASTHRFVERRDIAVEVADVALCVLSVAYELNFSDEELESIMWAKAEKWDGLQVREAGVKYPLPYEIHVTVDQASPEEFKAACADLEVKPIVLALQDKEGVTMLHDVMTSSVHMGNNQTAALEVERIVAGLTAKGLNVVRRKVETVPWHPAAPSNVSGVNIMPKDCYFESHLNVVISATDAVHREQLMTSLSDITKKHNAHLSRNAFKMLSDTAFTIMVTLRSYTALREEFDQLRNALVSDITEASFPVEKVITEFSVFDSKVSHDKSWLKG